MKSAVTDWEEVRERLRASEDALQRALSEDPDRVRSVFRQRAIELAKRSAQVKVVSNGIPALVFRLAGGKYAIKLSELTEVLPFKGCTPVPGGSPKFLGVINVRGEIRPVIDLELVLSEKPSGGAGFVLFLKGQTGLKVDEIEDLRQIHLEEFGPSSHGRFIRGLAPGPVMLLDVEAVLSAKGVLRK